MTTEISFWVGYLPTHLNRNNCPRPFKTNIQALGSDVPKAKKRRQKRRKSTIIDILFLRKFRPDPGSNHRPSDPNYIEWKYPLVIFAFSKPKYAPIFYNNVAKKGNYFQLVLFHCFKNISFKHIISYTFFLSPKGNDILFPVRRKFR